MRGCGTVFTLSEGDLAALNDVERLAIKHEFIARFLREAVAKCKASNSTEGLTEMVAFSFNSQQFQPSYGGGGANLPPGKYKGVIVDSRQEMTQDKSGGFLALDLTPIEGPLAGQKHTDRLNLHNKSQVAVDIANKQMSAYCHVLGVYQVQDTAQLHNIPFVFEIGYQKGQEPTQEKPQGGYTEVKAIFDVNGNEPGKAGQGPVAGTPAQPPAQPPAGVGPQGQPAAWGAPAGQPPASPPAAAPPAAWGAPPQGQPPAAGAPPAAPWGAPPASAAPPGWGGQ